MTSADLRQLKRRQPFVPFRLHLADGRAFDVPHHRLILVEREFAVVGILPPGSRGTICQYTVNILLADVVRTEDLQSAPAGPPQS